MPQAVRSQMRTDARAGPPVIRTPASAPMAWQLRDGLQAVTVATTPSQAKPTHRAVRSMTWTVGPGLAAGQRLVSLVKKAGYPRSRANFLAVQTLAALPTHVDGANRVQDGHAT